MKIDTTTDRASLLFYDMESEAFGYGYGTGEQYIVPLLKQFVTTCMKDGGSFDCEEMAKVIGHDNTWFLVNALCRVDFLDYGTSPRYCWIDHSEDARLLANFIVHCPSDELYAITEWDIDKVDMLRAKLEDK